MPGSPAEEAGIEVGDVIVEFGGDTIEDPRELQRVVADADIGSSVEATVRRGDGTETLTVRLGRMETGRQVADRPVETNEDRIGMSLAPMTPEIREQLGIDPAEGGVVSAAVEEGGPAAQAGLQPGDVITRVGPRPIEDRKSVV